MKQPLSVYGFVTALCVALMLTVFGSETQAGGTLSAISANMGTVTAGSMSGVTATFGGTVTLNSSGITIAYGSGGLNSINWTDGGRIYSNLSNGITLLSASGGSLSFSGSGGYDFNGSSAVGFGKDLGQSVNPWGTTYTNDVNLGSGTITKSAWAGGSNRALCVDTGGTVYVASGTTCP